MFNTKIALRLAVTLIAATCILICLAYWWQDNRTHEVVGIAFLAAVIRHLYVNRSWFLNLRRGAYSPRRTFSVILQGVLAVNVAALVMTSIAISQWAFAPLGIRAAVQIRDLHWVSAYWLVIIVGMHLGLHWGKVLALVRSGLRIRDRNVLRTSVLRVAAAAVFATGLWGLIVLEVGTKLTWNFSIAFWDFNESVWPFFAYWGSVMALPAIVVHYGSTFFSAGKSGAIPN